jgi:Uma2 family endonuclease
MDIERQILPRTTLDRRAETARPRVAFLESQPKIVDGTAARSWQQDDATMSRMPGRDDLRPSSSRLKLTYDDFVLFPDDGQRHELIDGEHFVTPSPNIRHQQILFNLTLLLGSWLEHHPIGRVFFAPLDVVFSHFDVVEPDLLYLSNERMAEIVTLQHVRGAPELVVEIGSPGTRQRDETIKRRLYEHFGVTEYWVVDPELDVVRIYRREGDEYARANELSREAADAITTPLIPGLEMPLERIFRE